MRISGGMILKGKVNYHAAFKRDYNRTKPNHTFGIVVLARDFHQE
jgi:hypothetical protein